jgi:hypothetical protein
MFRSSIALLLLLSALSNFAGAGDLVTVVTPEAPVTKRILFVVDVSGSMGDNSKIIDAIACVNTATQQPVDDMEIAVMAFSDGVSRWQWTEEAVEGHPIAPNWARMPSEKVSEASQFWLRSLGASGNTYATYALNLALHEPVKELTIVVLSDGIFCDAPGSVLLTIDAGQAWRESNDLGRALIVTVAVAAPDFVTGIRGAHPDMATLGTKGGGGCFLVTKEEKHE